MCETQITVLMLAKNKQRIISSSEMVKGRLNKNTNQNENI